MCAAYFFTLMVFATMHYVLETTSSAETKNFIGVYGVLMKIFGKCRISVLLTSFDEKCKNAVNLSKHSKNSRNGNFLLNCKHFDEYSREIIIFLKTFRKPSSKC